MDIEQIALVLLGGVGGALLTLIGTLVNNRINHKREMVRMTYQRKLMVCENTMGILGSAKDMLTSISMYLRHDLEKIDAVALQETAIKMQNLINTTETELYKLYLYYDIEQIERKLKLQELIPMVMVLNTGISEFNDAIAQGAFPVDEQERQIQKIIASYEDFSSRLDNFFTEIIEIIKRDVKGKLK